jgi:hypothetical protein
MQNVCTSCKVEWIDKFYGGYFCVMENHIEYRKSCNYVGMLLFKMHSDNGFSIIFNSYITQDLTCAGLPAVELWFMDGTSIGYAIYMYDCFKAEFVIEFILLNW